jgi:hypothetical protein
MPTKPRYFIGGPMHGQWRDLDEHDAVFGWNPEPEAPRLMPDGSVPPPVVLVYYQLQRFQDWEWNGDPLAFFVWVNMEFNEAFAALKASPYGAEIVQPPPTVPQRLLGNE